MTEQTQIDPRLTELYDPVALRYFIEGNPVKQGHPEFLRKPVNQQIAQFRQEGMPINTEFFNEPEAIVYLKNRILPNTPKDKPLRIASVGCSNGKEPFSILLSLWDQRDQLIINAYDSNLEAMTPALDERPYLCTDEDLKKIKLYGPKNPDPAYFVMEGPKGGYPRKFNLNLKAEARKRVNFDNHDIFEAKLPGQQDVIFLMNLLRSYQPKGRGIILDNVFDSLDEGGLLLCEAESYHQDYEQWMLDLGYFGFKKAGQEKVYRKSSALRYPTLEVSIVPPTINDGHEIQVSRSTNRTLVKAYNNAVAQVMNFPGKRIHDYEDIMDYTKPQVWTFSFGESPEREQLEARLPMLHEEAKKQYEALRKAQMKV
jgi:chemotaxis methyl-accepting protein methylase